MDSVNVSKKVTRKEMSGGLLVLTDSPWIMHSTRIEQKCFFPQWHLSVLSQEVVLDLGQDRYKCGEKERKRDRGVANRKLDEKNRGKGFI